MISAPADSLVACSILYTEVRHCHAYPSKAVPEEPKRTGDHQQSIAGKCLLLSSSLAQAATGTCWARQRQAHQPNRGENERTRSDPKRAWRGHLRGRSTGNGDWPLRLFSPRPLVGVAFSILLPPSSIPLLPSLWSVGRNLPYPLICPLPTPSQSLSHSIRHPCCCPRQTLLVSAPSCFGSDPAAPCCSWRVRSSSCSASLRLRCDFNCLVHPATVI